MSRNNKNSLDLSTCNVLGLQLAPNGLFYSLGRDGEIMLLAEKAYQNGVSPAESLHRILAETPSLRQAFTRVNVLVETDRVCMVPERIAPAETESNYLEIMGIFPSEGECILHTHPSKELSALLPLDQTLLDILYAQYGAELSFFHPLQICLCKEHKEPTLEINLASETVNLVAADPRLRYCESFPCQEIEQLLFYLAQLDTIFVLRNYRLVLSGEGAEEVIKKLRVYFRHTQLDKELPCYVRRAWRAKAQHFHNLIYTHHANY